MHAQLMPLVSSNVEGMLHLTGGTLIVAFTSGALYAYEGVPASVAQEFAQAESKGRFLNLNIKGAGYAYRRTTEAELDQLAGGQGTSVPRRRAPSDPLALAGLLERYAFLRFAF